MFFRTSRRYYVLACGLVLLVGGGAFSHPSIRTAYRRIRNKTDANDGRALFLANCAPCHGLAARGGRGPALVGRQLVHGASDKEILTVVQEGVPGSAMPAFGGSPDELHNIMAYIRSLSGAAASKAPHPGGNAALGSAAYERYGCAGCHRIGNTGSVFGPELTRVGASRSYDYLKQSLLDPSADITPGAEGITVTTFRRQARGGNSRQRGHVHRATARSIASFCVLLEPLRFVRDSDGLQLRLSQAPIDRG